MSLKLNYLDFEGRHLLSHYNPDDDPDESLLADMVEMNPLINFFYTMETTDIFEKEWNFNQVAGFEPRPTFNPPGVFVLEALEQMADRRRDESHE